MRRIGLHGEMNYRHNLSCLRSDHREAYYATFSGSEQDI